MLLVDRLDGLAADRLVPARVALRPVEAFAVDALLVVRPVPADRVLVDEELDGLAVVLRAVLRVVLDGRAVVAVLVRLDEERAGVLFAVEDRLVPALVVLRAVDRPVVDRVDVLRLVEEAAEDRLPLAEGRVRLVPVVLRPLVDRVPAARVPPELARLVVDFEVDFEADPALDDGLDSVADREAVLLADRWVGSRGSLRLPSMTSLKFVPGRKAGTVVFLTFTASPVRGFRAVRAALALFSKTPNPEMFTLSPLLTLRTMTSTSSSTAAPAVFLSPRRCESASTSSALFTFGPSRDEQCARSPGSARGACSFRPALASP
ncbi:hypothetical protein UA75_26420 [Actinoalloteichus sp. GBA129-24]|uniref:Uncharacterized protein n=1 Tax=Actinoalloteichus fjordicus TaxID=1612552 RepID=A0AAC9LIX7_9PSEU|nr:hypothetical protein UA74_25835 [Actinoalloteichus fjordicus]APU23257.1 hypothetical protein UA75_26420 [Actinoalloteichus sp. GBA129-24]